MYYGPFSEGIIPVKLYEYLALNKTIISVEEKDELFQDEIKKYLKIVSDSSQFTDAFKGLYADWNNNLPLSNNVPREWITQFSRTNQSKILAELIHQLV